MKTLNEMKLSFPSRSANEAFSRTALSAFTAMLDPTIEELADIKTAVSEAVTNAIVHAYGKKIGIVYIHAKILEANRIVIRIRDTGCGIEDVKQAMEPMYTTCATGERSGLGFAVMEAFMDKVKVRSRPGHGTSVTLEKTILSKGAELHADHC
ncbi:MAG: anti-sigma F factor [Oscillospiraceae bacterium]|nr:anti-sigma F factor [Oscillospiraceae bacterium]